MNVMMKWLLGSIVAFAACVAQAQNVNGTLRVVKGDVQIKSAKTGETTKARIGQQVFPKDVILTGKDARAKIVMVDNNEINVSPESQIEIQHYEFDPAAGKKDVLLNVIYGKVRAKVEQKYDGKTSKFQVKTPSAVAGVRGTDFMTSYNQANNTSQVVTFRGAVEFGLPGPNGSIQNPVSVTPGKMANSLAGQPPAAPTSMPKDQLAKMDNDSKAEGVGAPAKPDAGKSERAPSNDGSKKDDGAKKDDGSGGQKSSGGNAGAGANAAPASNGSSTASSNDGSATSGSDGGRKPAAVAPMTTAAPPPPGPSAGLPPMGGMGVLPQDMPSTGGVAPVLPTSGLPPTIPTVSGPLTTVPPPCAVCNQLIQNGNTKLNVHVSN